MSKAHSRFSLLARLRSFAHAFRGLGVLVREEHNARVHLLALVVVVLAGWHWQLSGLEWVAVLLCAAGVLSLEAVNSSLENLADKLSPGHDPLVGKAKDLAAAAVLIFAFFSALVGAIIFLPKIFP